MNSLEKRENYDNQTFEEIKHINENGIEYWYARELQLVLNYKEWRKFENVINKAKESCKNSDISTFEHFVGADKTIKMPKGANTTHYNIGKNIREVIAKNGGTMPEDLPTPEKSLKQLEKENKKSLKAR